MRVMTIKVRWFDGYFEKFEARAARSGNSILYIKLVSGEDRWVPLQQVRWFSGLK